MMQNQKTERLTSVNGNVTSGNTEACNTANEHQMFLNIDFDNIEDILDFSAPRIPITGSTKNPEYSPKVYKLTAGEPFEVLQVQPTIHYFATDEGINSEEEYKIDLKKKRRFQCIYCGNKFIRSTHLNRHLRIHTGAKPYFCSVCRRRFSRSDCMLAHFYQHRNDKVHYCCVCGEAYYDLERFANHCRSHDDSEYLKIAMSNGVTESEADLQKEGSISDPVATSTEQLELNSCETVENVDNSTDEECIEYVDNPLYFSYHKAISINRDAATLLRNASSSESLRVSINVVHY